MKVLVPVRFRMFLMGALRQERGKRKDEKRQVNRDVFRKIVIGDNELALYETVVPGVGAILHQERINSAKDIEVEFTPAELRRISAVVDNWEHFGPDDDAWLDPAMEKLGKIE